MRAMMLNRYTVGRRAVQPLRREMSTAGWASWTTSQLVLVHVVHREEVVDRLPKCLERVVVVEIADVLAHERLAVDHQRDRVLQIGAERQDRALRRHSRDRAGRIAADRRRITGPNAPARTTESSTRRAIGRSPIRNASAMPASCSRASSSSIRDRLARTVRAGHDQHRRRAGGEQQMMQRRIRQHDAELVVVRRDFRQLDFRAGASTIGRAADVQQRLRLGR